MQPNTTSHSATALTASEDNKFIGRGITSCPKPMRAIADARACTFGRARYASSLPLFRIRLRFFSSTTSGSMRTIRPTPRRANCSTTTLPVPEHPTTAIDSVRRTSVVPLPNAWAWRREKPAATSVDRSKCVYRHRPPSPKQAMLLQHHFPRACVQKVRRQEA